MKGLILLLTLMAMHNCFSQISLEITGKKVKLSIAGQRTWEVGSYEYYEVNDTEESVLVKGATVQVRAVDVGGTPYTGAFGSNTSSTAGTSCQVNVSAYATVTASGTVRLQWLHNLSTSTLINTTANAINNSGLSFLNITKIN
jgi:hypothetical protein